MSKQKIIVGFAGARWLGVECFKLLSKRSDVEIKAVCFPKRSEHVWWKDVVDENEVKKLGFKITPWNEWQNLKFDIAFSVLHGGIFKANHIDNCRFGVINLHPAPLPEYRGCNSYAHAIMNGDKTYRVTMHYIEPGIDTGPIIDYGKLPINADDTGYSLYNNAQKVAFGVFKKNLPGLINSAKGGTRVEATKQNESKARYYKRDSLKNKEADINWGDNKLYNFVRALDFPPFEPSFTVKDGQKIFLITKKRLQNL